MAIRLTARSVRLKTVFIRSSVVHGRCFCKKPTTGKEKNNPIARVNHILAVGGYNTEYGVGEVLVLIPTRFCKNPKANAGLFDRKNTQATITISNVQIR